jgi:hypothetical protein
MISVNSVTSVVDGPDIFAGSALIVVNRNR